MVDQLGGSLPISLLNAILFMSGFLVLLLSQFAHPQCHVSHLFFLGGWCNCSDMGSCSLACIVLAAVDVSCSSCLFAAGFSPFALPWNVRCTSSIHGGMLPCGSEISRAVASMLAASWVVFCCLLCVFQFVLVFYLVVFWTVR